jgi:uncharacterized membrane protein
MTLVPLHAGGAAVAIVTGFVALCSSKGAALHRKSGTIFVYAMLSARAVALAVPEAI